MDDKNIPTVSALARRLAATNLNQPNNDTNEVTIRISGPATASDETLVADLTRLIMDHEKGKDFGGHKIIDHNMGPSHVQARLRRGEFAIALVRTENNNNKADDDPQQSSVSSEPEPPREKLAGCIRIKKFSATTGGFRELVVDPAYRKTGLGRRLIRFAEKRCRDDLGLTAMRQEFLSPNCTELPKYLFTLGYVMKEVCNIEEAYPELKPLLPEAYKCYVMEKQLAA
ncbi:hypothetical protein EV127DRAFT_101518 [Xylaria flabelliformis]|nr:hypothetical protein EV127DRAFT_101518 [Xylaria flabelliformis]